MLLSASRAGRWPLALTLIAVAACADDAPTTAPHPTRASGQALDGNVILVTTASGANVPGSLQWAVGVADGTSVIQFDTSLAGDTIPLDAPPEPFSYIMIEAFRPRWAAVVGKPEEHRIADVQRGRRTAGRIARDVLPVIGELKPVATVAGRRRVALEDRVAERHERCAAG